MKTEETETAITASIELELAMWKGVIRSLNDVASLYKNQIAQGSYKLAPHIRGKLMIVTAAISQIETQFPTTDKEPIT